MVVQNEIAFIETMKELCRTCYTCVRECPGKAIRIVEGQAMVVPERCVACGNCVKVCTQKAKQPVSTLHEVEEVLDSGVPAMACVAPSFPAEFVECDERELAGMLRRLGFEKVVEVSFGADLVADRYRTLVSETSDRRYIATSCPAVIGFVERYHPDLVDALAPIVSPMVACARAMRLMFGTEWKVVFIGPCIAKKVEAKSQALEGEVDAVITFHELRDLFNRRGVEFGGPERCDFDSPQANLGGIFAISRGMLQAAGLKEDLVSGEVVATKGRSNFLEALREFSDGNLDAKLLEVLCCQGCVMGPGMSKEAPLYPRRAQVSRYVRRKMEKFSLPVWQTQMDMCKELDLSRRFTKNDQRLPVPDNPELSAVLERIGKMTPVDELNCGACGYDTCREHAIAICKGLAETEMCLPHTIGQLRSTVKELAESHEKLASTQKALMQSEKLASMGQLAAGIAHEVNNPLGVVLMYAHLMLEQCEQNSNMRQDLSMIVEQADRCKKIVAGLLHFARQNKVLRQPIDLGQLIDSSLATVPAPPGITVEVRHHMGDREVEVDGDQIIQVLTNLISNAYAAMPGGGALMIETESEGDQISITLKDTGFGIPPENRKKIFEPFFTTKQIGKGTGLGLAVAYGIIKMHKGDIQVDSNSDPALGPTWTSFVITLARNEGSLG